VLRGPSWSGRQPVSENFEIVRRVHDAVGRRDRKALIALFDREVELDYSGSPLAGLIGAGTYRGRRGLVRFFRALHEAPESIEDDLEELIDVADDRVVSVVALRWRGRAGGTEETHHAGVWTIREDTVVRVVWFPTRTEALQAAGLEH
jgi:ketosteroid isomerase-like protein